MKFRCLLVLATISCLASIGCHKQAGKGSKKIEPAHVAHPVSESQLNTITLTPEATERLGIQTAEITLKTVPRMRAVGGEVVLPAGKTTIVTAPLAGTLAAHSDGKVPVPGSKVEQGQAIFEFTPLLTPERDVLTPAERVQIAQSKAMIITTQIEAERMVETAKAQLERSHLALDRAQKVFESKAGSQRTVDEATADLKIAQEQLTAAESRNEFLTGIVLDEQTGTVESRTIKSPAAGILQTLAVTPGETVTAGAVLFQVAQFDLMWIRVPIYAGQLRQIDTEHEATISEFGQSDARSQRVANFVEAPPTANPLGASVDLFYGIDNHDGALIPGQRLAVTIPLKSEKPESIVRWSAIVYDIQGGTWVYEQTGENIFVRRRVDVKYIDMPNAILAAGPEPGTRVVSEGAAELFGTEFGAGK